MLCSALIGSKGSGFNGTWATIEGLLAAGASVVGYDPVAMDNMRALNLGLEFAEDMYKAAHEADALVICTEWSEFRTPDLTQLRNTMRSPVVFDGRNLWEPDTMAELGFTYSCVGRPRREPSAVTS